MLTHITDTIGFDDRFSLVKSVFSFHLHHKNIKISDNDLNILTLFSGNSDEVAVIEEALDREFVNSFRSGENTVSLLVKLNLLLKTNKKVRTINPEILPVINCDRVAIEYKIYNRN